MKRFLHMVTLSFCLMLLFACHEKKDNQEEHPIGAVMTSPVPPGTYLVGVSVKDITPSQSQIEAGEVNMGGNGFLGIRDFTWPPILSIATDVLDPLYVRAMVIDLDGRALALAVLDAAGIGNRIIDEINSMVAQATGLRESQIYIANTHSHNAPDLQGYCGGVSAAYRARVIDRTVAAISDAYGSRGPVNLYVSLGQGQSNNRRGWDYTDSTIPVLDARAIATDETIGILINFGCHPTILSKEDTELSRDYVGHLVDYAEASLGAPVIFVQGILGDATSDTRGLVYSDRFERAQAYGEHIAQQALASMMNQTLIESEVYIDTFPFEHIVTNPLLLVTSLLFGSQLEYDIEFDLFEGLSFQTQVGYVRLGKQVQIAILPGESLTNHGLSIKNSMSAPFKMVFCQASDSLGYLIPTDEWLAGPNGVNYEETFAFDEQLGDVMRDHLVEMIE